MNKRLAKYLKATEEALKVYLYCELVKNDYQPIYEKGFLYAEGNIPILLVAHLDTVFPMPPKKIVQNTKTKAISSPDGGLGADDRLGVYAIMTLLKEYKPYVLFTQGEEIGGYGATLAVNKIERPDIKYIIEFDRKNSQDCVFYDCDNLKFMNYIENFGFKRNIGSFSDICILGKFWDIAAVNLSVGYYKAHTDKEYFYQSELENTIDKAKIMLKSIDKAPYFSYFANKLSDESLSAEWEELYNILFPKEPKLNLKKTNKKEGK